MIRVGSVFSGIGGFEIGIEAAFGDSVKTVLASRKRFILSEGVEEALAKHSSSR